MKTLHNNIYTTLLYTATTIQYLKNNITAMTEESSSISNTTSLGSIVKVVNHFEQKVDNLSFVKPTLDKPLLDT